MHIDKNIIIYVFKIFSFTISYRCVSAEKANRIGLDKKLKVRRI